MSLHGTNNNKSVVSKKGLKNVGSKKGAQKRGLKNVDSYDLT